MQQEHPELSCSFSIRSSRGFSKQKFVEGTYQPELQEQEEQEQSGAIAKIEVCLEDELLVGCLVGSEFWVLFVDRESKG